MIGEKGQTLEEALQQLLLQKVEEVAEKIAESREVMNTEEAAEFLRMKPGTFAHIAPGLPRHQISPQRFLYTRRELLAWLEGR